MQRVRIVPIERSARGIVAVQDIGATSMCPGTSVRVDGTARLLWAALGALVRYFSSVGRRVAIRGKE
jgi:hypothetical protein